MLIKSYSSMLWCLVTALLLQVALSWPPCSSSLMSFHSAAIHGFQVWDTATCHHSSLSAVICTSFLTFSWLVIAVSVPFCSEPSVHHLCMVIMQKMACTLKAKGAYHCLHSSSINPIYPSRCAWEVRKYSSKPCEEQYHAEDTHLSLLICMLVLAQNGAASCWCIFC